ncbi:hypothetical protein BYT27DRAFT_6408459 [Phlegmacium glaucopus]|nr:hypothetical protein BYT27DRAFT_6408459 [Phlegmacium glaucopus]
MVRFARKSALWAGWLTDGRVVDDIRGSMLYKNPGERTMVGRERDRAGCVGTITFHSCSANQPLTSKRFILL